MSGDRLYVYYPGHLGPSPAIETRGLAGQPFDGPGVRSLPAKIGKDLIRFSGFHEAVPVDLLAGRFGLSAPPERALLGEVVTYQDAEDSPELDLAVLDPATIRRLRKSAAPEQPVKTTPDEPAPRAGRRKIQSEEE